MKQKIHKNEETACLFRPDNGFYFPCSQNKCESRLVAFPRRYSSNWLASAKVADKSFFYHVNPFLDRSSNSSNLVTPKMAQELVEKLNDKEFMEQSGKMIEEKFRKLQEPFLLKIED